MNCNFMEMRTSAGLKRRQRRQAAFSLVEAVIGMALLGTVIGALLTSFTTGFFAMNMSRENLRATQIMLEKMETIRLYSWSQVTRPNFIPPTFTSYYDPNSTNGGGASYQGTLDWSPVTGVLAATPYANQITQLTVRVQWRTGSLQRSRTFTTFVAHNGLQKYVF